MSTTEPFDFTPRTSSDSNLIRSRRPSNTAFKQQRLAAWQPILTTRSVLPTFFLIGVLFTPVGIGLWYFSDNVNEKIIPYTDCRAEEFNDTCANVIRKYSLDDGTKIPECTCKLTFTLEKDFKGRVFIYYGLTKFYQNHRRYVKSRHENQLYGGEGKPSTDCNPYAMSKDGKFVWPCGAIANSMFKDEITLYSNTPGDLKPVDLKRTGIAWESDIEYRFKNPTAWLTEDFKTKHVKPKAWKKGPWELDLVNPHNNGLKNEDFIVWMRTAALANFRKLYRIVNQEIPGFTNGVQKGEYMLQIQYTHPVTSFQGTKLVIISTTTLLGGKNHLMGLSYVVMGGICLFLGIVYGFPHWNF